MGKMTNRMRTKGLPLCGKPAAPKPDRNRDRGERFQTERVPVTPAGVAARPGDSYDVLYTLRP